MTFLADLAAYEFLQKALLTSVLVGVLSGLVGTFVILRGLALMGDAISHAVLPGVALSYMLGVNFFFGAFGFGLLTALGIGFITQRTRLKNDSAIGIVFSAFLALGVVLVARAQTAIDLTQILFGNVLAVKTSEMYLTVGVFILVLVMLVLFYKELQVSTFDPTLAAVYGVPVRTIHYGLLVTLTLVSVVALQTVGVLLVVALLITPAATAYLLTDRLPVMLGLAALFGAVSAVAGLYLSFITNLPSGAVVVLVASALFVLALGVTLLRQPGKLTSVLATARGARKAKAQ